MVASASMILWPLALVSSDVPLGRKQMCRKRILSTASISSVPMSKPFPENCRYVPGKIQW
jgi:hypothetical protein